MFVPDDAPDAAAEEAPFEDVPEEPVPPEPVPLEDAPDELPDEAPPDAVEEVFFTGSFGLLTVSWNRISLALSARIIPRESSFSRFSTISFAKVSL